MAKGKEWGLSHDSMVTLLSKNIPASLFEAEIARWIDAVPGIPPQTATKCILERSSIDEVRKATEASKAAEAIKQIAVPLLEPEELPDPLFGDDVTDAMKHYQSVKSIFTAETEAIGTRLLGRFFSHVKDAHPSQPRVYASFKDDTCGREAKIAYIINQFGLFTALWRYIGFLPGPVEAAKSGRVDKNKVKSFQMW
jgi:hypothetical protein